jgi:hypothetical protein
MSLKLQQRFIPASVNAALAVPDCSGADSSALFAR